MNQSPNNSLKENNNLDLILMENINILCEKVNPFAVEYAANGKMLFKSWMEEMCSFIIKSNYDGKELDKYIDDCDKLLDDITEEKRNIRKHKSDDHLKFSTMYIFNILKSIFSIFIFPLILKSKSIHWPAKLEKLIRIFVKENPTKWQKALSTTGMVYKTVVDIPPDIKGLYLSFNDYEYLLNDYERKIKDVKKTFVKKQEKLNHKEMNRSMSLDKLTEDVLPSGAVEVHYQSPEELRMKDEHTPEVVHDNDSINTNLDNSNHDEPEVPAPVVYHDIEPETMGTHDFSPLDALHQAKANPLCVPIAKCGDGYYVDHNDLQCYMDACKESSYERALNSIISAHENYDLCSDSIKVVLCKEDMNNISSEMKARMESSNVQFEVY